MILLNIFNIARYVFTVLLATLGIIPYDAVYVNTDYRQDTIRAARLAENRPMTRMEPLLLQQQLFDDVGHQRDIPLIASISPRDRFSVGCMPESPKPEEAFAYVLDLEDIQEITSKIIIVRSGVEESGLQEGELLPEGWDHQIRSAWWSDPDAHTKGCIEKRNGVRVRADAIGRAEIELELVVHHNPLQ